MSCFLKKKKSSPLEHRIAANFPQAIEPQVQHNRQQKATHTHKNSVIRDNCFGHIGQNEQQANVNIKPFGFYLHCN